MKRSNRLILLIGVFLAALAFVLVVVLLGGKGAGGGGTQNANVPPAKVATVVAARNLALGLTITPDMVTTQDLAPADRLPGAFGTPSQVIGQVIRQSLTEGQQVTAAVFSQTNQSFEVPAGFSAIAVQVDQVTGAGTLIKAGDYVDVIAQVSPAFPVDYFVPLVPASTHLAGGDPAKYDPTSIKVLLQGVQVVATLVPPPAAAASGASGAQASGAPSDSTTSLNGQQEIVLLAVTQQQAEVIKFAQTDGSISLALRSPKDFVDAKGNPIVPKTVTTTGLVLKTMIENWGVLPPLPIVVPAPSAAR